MAVARRQLLEQQTMAQARLRQPTAALRTHLLTHRARALFAAALGASDDLHTRPVSMQGLTIEQCRGKQARSNPPTATIGLHAAYNLTPPH